MKKTIFLTGGTGFIGSAIIERLLIDSCFRVVATTRKNILSDKLKFVTINSIDENTNWLEYLKNIDVVIHTAARVHMMKDNSDNPLNDYRKINVEGTLNLARQAVKSGVKRFIFISSIKVNGESTNLPTKAFNSEDKVNPIDYYGISKFEAEEGLKQISKLTGLEVVIIRPPLVYGPGVKANFHSMMKWLQKGIPLPFGAIHNKRSLVAIDNLVDLIVTCINHPNAKNQIFLVSDDDDISTTELLKRMAKVLKKKVLLVPIPMSCLKIGAILFGKKNLSQRLFGSLQVDINKTKKLLEWKPVISVDQALLKTADAFLANKSI